MRGIPDTYSMVVEDGWRVWVASEWKSHVSAMLREECRRDGWIYQSKHARTRRLELPDAPPAYMKSYRPYRLTTRLKDMLRRSKGLHALVMSDALERAGFTAASVAAAGEYRAFGSLRGAFLVTRAVDGPDLGEFLRAVAVTAPATKRRFLRVLGGHVGHMHDAGFCHGDLVPANVRVVSEAAGPRIVLLDHDRTRAWPGRVPQWQARRNLVQLNRFVVDGLTATDRWRVFRAYCATLRLDERTSRRLARWVVAKTIQRRRRFDGIETASRMGFRALMQASVSPPITAGTVGRPGASDRTRREADDIT